MSRVGRLGLGILLLAALIGGILAVVQVGGAAPAGPTAVTPDLAPAAPLAPGSHVPGPAASELLARIRSCSPTELENVVDRISAAEALGIYNQLSPADRQAVFAAVPAPLLARKANQLLGIPEGAFRRIGASGTLAPSLLDAVMGTAVSVDPAQRKELSFATALGDQGMPTAPRASFRPGDRKIYACMPADPDASGDPGVLVRWSDEGSGALVYLHYLPLSQNRPWNHVYFEVAEPWPTATYRVRFYRIGERAELVAEGAYTVRAGE